MLDDKKIRQNLQHKIRMQEQKLNTSNKNSLSSAIDNNSDFLKRFSQLDLEMEDGYNNNNKNESFLMQNSQQSSSSSQTSQNKRSSRQSSNKLELQQRWHEIEQQQQKITTIQKDIDLYRREMLTLVANEQQMKQLRQTQRIKRQRQVQGLSLQHKLNIDRIKKEEEQKIEECLQKIEKLIVEKAEFNKDCEKFRMEEKKMDKLLKDQTERYRVDMKAVKQAFVAIQKDKRGKWEKQRVQILKQQAITDTEPKILEIIKQSNLQIKNAEKKQAEMLDMYKRETKQKYERQLQQLQEKLFNEQEEHKEKLRVEESQKASVRYQEMQRQFSSDRDKMREEYNKQVHELEGKVRVEISQFITRNKESHDDHLGEIKQLRENYEQRVRKMRENVRQRVEGEVVAVEKKHVARYEMSLLELEKENVKKYQKAEEKIRGEINKRIEKIRVEVEQMKADYQQQVDAQYDQKLYDEEQRQLADKDNVKKAVEKLQQTVVVEQRKLAKESSRIRQTAGEIEKLSTMNFTLEQRLTELETQLSALTSNEQSLQLKLKDHSKLLEERLKQEYQLWRGKVLKLDDEKQAKEKELVEVYVGEQNKLDEEMSVYREEIERNLEKRMAEIARVKDELKLIEHRNEQKTRMLQEQRKRLQ